MTKAINKHLIDYSFMIKTIIDTANGKVTYSVWHEGEPMVEGLKSIVIAYHQASTLIEFEKSVNPYLRRKKK